MLKIKQLIALSTLALGCVINANAITIEDNYTGAGDELLAPFGLSRDVLGGEIYEVYSADITFAGSLMSVTINTDFLESDPLNTGGYLLGDLFISTDGWNPFGSANYALDDSTNGEDWEYAFDTSAGTVVSVTGIDVLGDEVGDCCRMAQEILVTEGTDTGAAVSFSGPVSSGSSIWDYEYTYVFDYELLGISAGDELGFHWVMTCGNDVIEGMVTVPTINVPEPGSLGLAVLGSLVLLRRRLKK